ncbi:MAG TPA: hypothetical protein VEW68_08190 [Patescibacteria group bacterium]|nr:hypothetical protein [Patescibacteria group bacterium]
MPPVAVLAPIAIPLIAAGLITAFGIAGINFGRFMAGAGALGSALSLSAVWIAVRSTQELNIGSLGFADSVAFRIDAVAFAFGLIIVLPAALILALQPREWQAAAMATLGLAAAMCAVEAGGLVVTALAGGTAAMLATAQLDTEEPSSWRPGWSLLLAAWVLLGLAGVILQVRGGTDAYAAVPVASFTVPVFALLAAAGLLSSGLAPWRMWPAQLLMRPQSRAAGMTVATLFPLGFYLFWRAYEMGDGGYPGAASRVVIASFGAIVALAAAVRAQAAGTQREFLAEAVMGAGGFALLTVSIGTPLGLAAGVITLVTSAALVASLALLPETPGTHALVAIAAAVGLPPGLAFGARVIGIASTFEAADYVGLIGVGGAVAWAVWMVAGARALRLPATGTLRPGTGFARISTGIAAASLLAGPGLAALQSAFAGPAQADVMSNQVGAASSLQSVVTVSTVVPALALFTPLLVLAGVALFFARRQVGAGTPRPALFILPGGSLLARVRAAAAGASVPDEYRSLVSPAALEVAAVAGRPVLWLGALVALGIAVTR